MPLWHGMPCGKSQNVSNAMDDETAGAAIVAAGPEHAERAIAVVTDAFANDPPSRWLFPERVAYLRYFPQFISALGSPPSWGRLTSSRAAKLQPIQMMIAASKQAKLRFVQRRGPSHRTISSAASETTAVMALAVCAAQKNDVIQQWCFVTYSRIRV